ncbi:MAG: hypothetical protein WC789_08455 [Lentisphaeria bacterium]
MAGKKKMGGRWTNRLWLIMVSLLCFGPLRGAETESAVPAGLQAQLQEERMARQVAEQRVAELSLALVRTERELEKRRAQSAELLLASRKLQEGLDGLQVRVASLLLGDGKRFPDEALAAVVAGLRTRQAEAQALTGAVREFGQYLSPVLDTLAMSDSLRREVRERMAGAMRACDRWDALPPLVARRGGLAAPRECRVLAVNPELGVIALDAGAAAGMRPGSWWQVRDQDREVARVRVIEVRSSLSAAQVVEGRIDRLAPGLTAQWNE